MKVRKNWISAQGSLPVSTQCALAGVNRSSWYGQVKNPLPSAEYLLLMQLIDEEYTRHPFYGTRRMKRVLLALGYKTPDEVYESDTGGGARIVDKYSQKKGSDEVSAAKQQQAAA